MSRNSHWGLKKKLKIKTCSADRISPSADPIRANDHSKHSKWRRSAGSAAAAENKVTFQSWLAETRVRLPVSRDVFTAALLTARDGGFVELKAAGVYFNISISAECQKRMNLSADLTAKTSTFWGSFRNRLNWLDWTRQKVALTTHQFRKSDGITLLLYSLTASVWNLIRVSWPWFRSSLIRPLRLESFL